MALKEGKADVLERYYTPLFRAMAAKSGIIIKYETDHWSCPVSVDSETLRHLTFACPPPFVRYRCQIVEC